MYNQNQHSIQLTDYLKHWVLHQNIAKDQIPNKKELQKMLEKKYGTMVIDGHRKVGLIFVQKEEEVF